jgi:hypothetical protein
MEGVTDQPSGQLSEQPQRSPPPSPSFQSEPAKVPAVFLAMQQEKLAAEKAAQVPFHSFSVATAAAHTVPLQPTLLVGVDSCLALA